MAETLQDAIGESVDTGDTADNATPETTAPEVTAVETTPAADTSPTETGEPEWRFDSAEFDQQHPELAPYRKQLQGSFTKAQQEIAEQRKALEGVDEGAIQWVRQVQGLAQTNPQLAAQMLEQERQRIAGLAPQPPPDPFQGTQFLSDGERVLAEQVKRLEAVVQQQELARSRAEIDQRFAVLEKEIGKEIKFEDRVKVAQFCTQNGIADPALGWKAMNWNVGVQMGRDQAAAVVAQKNGMGPAPGGVASREAPPSDKTPKSTREALEMAYEEAARTA